MEEDSKVLLEQHCKLFGYTYEELPPANGSVVCVARPDQAVIRDEDGFRKQMTFGVGYEQHSGHAQERARLAICLAVAEHGMRSRS